MLRGFTMDCGYNHYKRLMAEFNVVVDVFLSLDKVFQVSGLGVMLGHMWQTHACPGWRIISTPDSGSWSTPPGAGGAHMYL
jgi:hypothetical protein